MDFAAASEMVCSRGDESHNTYKTMAYSIASGRYFYEEGGDYFSFNALIDEMDHSDAGTFKNGQRIEDQGFSPSPGFFVLDNVQNFSGKPWNDGKFDYEYWDVKSYFDSDSGITKDEISGTGYDNGMPSLTPYGMEGEVEVGGRFRTFNTRDQLDFVQPPAPQPTPEPTPVAPSSQPTPEPDNPEWNDIYGTKRNDELIGTNAADAINGGKGDDFIYGDAGDDLIIGGKGIDFLEGGKGEDWFATEKKFGKGKKNYDVIADFVVGEDVLMVMGNTKGMWIDNYQGDAILVKGKKDIIAWIDNAGGQLEWGGSDGNLIM